MGAQMRRERFPKRDIPNNIQRVINPVRKFSQVPVNV
jgi:hypothetical protein